MRHARQNYGRRRARCDVTHVIVTLLLLLLLLGAVHVQRQELIDRHHGHAPDWYLTRATRTGRLLLLLRDVRWWRFCTSTSHTQCTHARAITTASVDFAIRTGHKNPYALFVEQAATYLNLPLIDPIKTALNVSKGTVTALTMPIFQPPRDRTDQFLRTIHVQCPMCNNNRQVTTMRVVKNKTTRHIYSSFDQLYR